VKYDSNFMYKMFCYWYSVRYFHWLGNFKHVLKEKSKWLRKETNMERRNFLKGLFGIVAVPSVCFAESLKYIKPKNIDINFNNININGTFDEWIESIRTEVERLLKPINKDDKFYGKYTVRVEPTYWGINRTMPAKAIIVSGEYRKCYSYFSLAEMEFKHNRRDKKRKYGLTRLVSVRFIDILKLNL